MDIASKRVRDFYDTKSDEFNRLMEKPSRIFEEDDFAGLPRPARQGAGRQTDSG